METEKVEAVDKHDFRKYLETNGTVDALTQALVHLFEEKEKPVDATDYITKYLNKEGELEREMLKKENEELKQMVRSLKEKLAQYETSEEVLAAEENEEEPRETDPSEETTTEEKG